MTFTVEHRKINGRPKRVPLHKRKFMTKINKSTGPSSARNQFAAEDRPSPLHVAQVILGPRLTEKHSEFYLDRLPVHLGDVIKETNRLLKQYGQPQITNNPEWRV